MLWRLRKLRATKMFNYACERCEEQLDRGDDAILEHPWSSWGWSLPAAKRLLKRMISVRSDACAHGLKDPVNGKPMKKDTLWLVSNPTLAEALNKQCPG
eukprot:5169488-Heterocapsa_arctica.AAC.1